MSYMPDAPNHWRYRYAGRVARPAVMYAINIAVVLGTLAAIVLGKPSIAVVSVALMAPFSLLLANLGCWRCNYNLFRRYRGSNSIEYGDSWTGQPLYPSRWVPIPKDCPKCGAAILGELSTGLAKND